MKRPIIRKTKFISLALALTLAGCGHEHNFSEATCESPKTCLECGEIEGEKLSHNWLEATIENPKTCSICGLTEGEPLEASEDNTVIEEKATVETNENDGSDIIGHDGAKTSSDILSNVESIRKDTEDQYKKGIIDKDMYDFMMEQLADLENDVIATESKPSTPSTSSSGITPEVQAILDEMGATDGTSSNEDLKGVQSLEGYGDPSLAGYRTN